MIKVASCNLFFVVEQQAYYSLLFFAINTIRGFHYEKKEE